jgi:hypothetical protein
MDLAGGPVADRPARQPSFATVLVGLAEDRMSSDASPASAR